MYVCFCYSLFQFSFFASFCFLFFSIPFLMIREIEKSFVDVVVLFKLFERGIYADFQCDTFFRSQYGSESAVLDCFMLIWWFFQCYRRTFLNLWDSRPLSSISGWDLLWFHSLMSWFIWFTKRSQAVLHQRHLRSKVLGYEKISFQRSSPPR